MTTKFSEVYEEGTYKTRKISDTNIYKNICIGSDFQWDRVKESRMSCKLTVQLHRFSFLKPKWAYVQ